MIAYIFTESELKFLCGALGVRGLAMHQFSENPLTDAECEQAIETLSEKDFGRCYLKQRDIEACPLFVC